jgi:hypothetical protein
MSQLSDISDSVIGVKRNISDISDGNGDSDSDSDSVDTIFSKNDNAVSGLVEPGKPILKKGIVPKSVNPTIPSGTLVSRKYAFDASKDAVFAGQEARKQAFLDDDPDYRAADNRREQNRFYNREARLEVLENDAKKRPEIIALFKKFEEENPPPKKARVTIDENQNIEGTSKRGTLEGTVTVEEKRIQKSRVVADNVSIILFELLKDIQPEDVNTKIDELIAKASRVNKSLKGSDDELTVRQLKHLYNVGLFDETIEMTFNKLNIYKNSDTAAYTKNIIDSVKDKLSSWLFDTTTEGGYSRSKTIKRSKKSKKRRSSKKLTKRIRSKKLTKRRSSLKQSKKRSKKRRT